MIIFDVLECLRIGPRRRGERDLWAMGLGQRTVARFVRRPPQVKGMVDIYTQKNSRGPEILIDCSLCSDSSVELMSHRDNEICSIA